MKQTTLEDLFYGNKNPNETSFVRGSEYGKCFGKVFKGIIKIQYHWRQHISCLLPLCFSFIIGYIPFLSKN